jgi:hypothetical protein
MRTTIPHAETGFVVGTRRELGPSGRVAGLVGGTILMLIAGCGNNSQNSDPTFPQVTASASSAPNQVPTSVQQQPIPKEKVNTDICHFVTNERVEKAVGWPEGTISDNTCDDGSKSNVPLPNGAVQPQGQAEWLVTRGFATVNIFDRSFIDASQQTAKDNAKDNNNELDTSTHDFIVNGHSGRWYPVLGIAEEEVNVGGNTFFVDVSSSDDNPQVTEAFAGNVVDDFTAANHG